MADPFERTIFLNEYRYFKSDRNISEYRNFIRNVLDKSRDANIVSDVIYFSVTIDFFSKNLFLIIKTILFSKRNYLVRLACLDYITHFKDKLAKNEFYELCEDVYKGTKSPLLRIQVLTNLLKINQQYFHGLIKLLKKIDHPTGIYRTLNGIAQNNIKITSEQFKLFKSLIINKNFEDGVRKELLAQLALLS